MLAIANKSVDARISVTTVRTLPVRTGEPVARYADDGLPAGVSPHTKDAQALDLRSARQGRPDDRPGNRTGSGASGDGGASCAWLFPARRKAEERTSQDAQASPVRGRVRPGARQEPTEEDYTTS